jgi:TetR/AcrR family transcriptional regulator, lmrAB and yxaGH operons repressor
MMIVMVQASQSRSDMLAGALVLLRERGYSGTSFSELIESTGAPRGSIYHHFPGGKQQLAREAIEIAQA